MGMYPERKEVPADLLARVLERPDDAEWVDRLLFVEVRPDVVGWSEAARTSAHDDGALARRFSCPYLEYSADERRQLGRLDLGKLPDPPADEEFWSYLEAVQPADPDETETRPAIHTDMPCYGINGYRTADTLSAMWRRIDRALTARPDSLDRVVNRFNDEIRYYYGCAARGSADLLVIW